MSVEFAKNALAGKWARRLQLRTKSWLSATRIEDALGPGGVHLA
jgi:hypothetical protein